MEQPKKKKKRYWSKDQEEAVVNYINLEKDVKLLNIKLAREKELTEIKEKTVEEKTELTRLKRTKKTTLKKLKQLGIEKNTIFATYLKDAVYTMTDSIIRRYKLFMPNTDYQDLHTDTISFMLERIHKFDPTRVSEKTGKLCKSFSYIQTIIKHRLMSNIQNHQKTIKRYTFYEDAYNTFKDDERLSYTIDDDADKPIKDLVKNLIEYIEYVIEFSATTLSRSELRVGNGVIDILQNWKDIFEPSENKKLDKNKILYSMRESLGMTTKEIRNSLKPFKKIYFLIKEGMIENDEF